MAWNAQQYMKFGDHRTRPAVDLLARVPVDDPRLVYDLGCGPGNSTRLLCERWPEARVIGVDNSPEMLAAALDEGPEAEWIECAVERFEPEEPPDVIFSNATLHWVADHARLFPTLLAMIRPGGTLAVQMPHRVPNEPYVAALHGVAHEGPWAERFETPPWGALGPRPKEYYEYLADGATNIDIWTTEYLQVLHGDDPVLEWSRGTALLPFLKLLGDDEQPAFVEAFRQRLLSAYPPRADGSTLFPFTRLFIVATR